MMYLAGLAALILMAYAGYRFADRTSIASPFQYLSFFKLHYLALGMLLAPLFPESFSGVFEQTREPLMLFSLSWIGIYFGCGLELRVHQKFPSNVILFNIIEPLMVITIITIVTGGVLLARFGEPGYFRVAAIVAAFSSFTIFRRSGILQRDREDTDHPVLNDLLPAANIIPVLTLSFAGSVLYGVPGVTIAGITFSGGAAVMLLHLLAGTFCGMLLNMLMAVSGTPDERTVVLVGAAALTGGIAYACNLSPVLLGTLTGAFLINATIKRLQALEALTLIQEIVERVFMFMLGTMIIPLFEMLGSNLVIIFAAAVVLFFLRAGIQYAGTALWAARILREPAGPSLIWIGLTGQGILAAAAAFETALHVRFAPAIVTLVVFLLILNQLAIGLYVWLKRPATN